jgi:DNA-binding CsgD family transcriptional regulator
VTAAERRVADLAARGLRNRDIAEALFVTIKTIEVHLAIPTPSSASAGGRNYPTP